MELDKQPRSAGGKFAKSDIKPDEQSNGDNGGSSGGAAGNIGLAKNVIDPAAIGLGNGSADGEPEKRKRGRPAGSTKSAGNETVKKTKALGVSGLESLLYSTHLLLSAALQQPDLALSEDEAKEIAKASANVAKHYDLGASEKVVDWGNLFLCLGVVYAPRIYKVVSMNKKDKPKQAATVFDLAANGI